MVIVLYFYLFYLTWLLFVNIVEIAFGLLLYLLLYFTNILFDL